MDFHTMTYQELRTWVNDNCNCGTQFDGMTLPQLQAWHDANCNCGTQFDGVSLEDLQQWIEDNCDCVPPAIPTTFCDGCAMPDKLDLYFQNMNDLVMPEAFGQQITYKLTQLNGTKISFEEVRTSDFGYGCSYWQSPGFVEIDAGGQKLFVGQPQQAAASIDADYDFNPPVTTEQVEGIDTLPGILEPSRLAYRSTVGWEFFMIWNNRTGGDRFVMRMTTTPVCGSIEGTHPISAESGATSVAGEIRVVPRP